MTVNLGGLSGIMLDKMIFTNKKDNFTNCIKFGEKSISVNGHEFWWLVSENQMRNFGYEIKDSNGARYYQRKGGTKSLKVKLLKVDEESIRDEINNLTYIAENQFTNKAISYLYIGEFYAEVMLTEIKFSKYLINKRYVQAEFTFYSDNWTWYKDTKIDYNPTLYQEQHIDLWREYRTLRGYPYGYEVNTNLNFNIPASFGDYAKAHAIIRLYGNSSSPFISDGIKRGAEITLLDGDYLEINTKNKTVVLHKANGTSESVFEKRMMSSDGSIFQNLSLPCTILASKGQKFDMVISEERGSPLWI